MKRKTLFSRLCLAVACAVLTGLTALADPSVTITRIQQRYPWNGLVDIDYTISGTETDSSAFDLALTLKATDASEAVRLQHFLQAAGCDLPTEVGTHRVTWDSAADNIKVLAPAASFTATIAKSTLTAATADFMVIDVSGGKDAASYPVRYGTGSDTSVFNIDTYKLDKIVLRRVSAGDYWIGTGNPVGDVSSAKLSIPSQRMRVRLTKDYYLGVFEVTQRQYERVTGLKPSRIVKNYKNGVLDDFRRPVEQVSYDTITAADTGFFSLLSSKSKVGATLVGTYQPPTEAQWEIAGRANTLTEFWWGTSANYGVLMSEYMWRYYNSYLEEAPTVKGTHPVGFKPANQWGFYDILGNVSEWTRDFYVTPYSLVGGDGQTYAGTEADPVVDPCQTASGTVRMLRGGNWGGGTDFYSNYTGCRGEVKGTPTSSNYQWGFRVSMTLP